MNTQLREALLSELMETHDYLTGLKDNDKRKFHTQRRFNLLNALLIHFDEQDRIIDNLGRSNDLLRKRATVTDNWFKATVRNVDREYGTTKWTEFYESLKD